jgi:hypothetical protein
MDSLPVPTHAHIDSLLAYAGAGSGNAADSVTEIARGLEQLRDTGTAELTARDADVLAAAGEQLKRGALGMLGAGQAPPETQREAHLRLRAADDFLEVSEIIRARVAAG